MSGARNARIGDAHDSSGRILLTLGEGDVAVDLDADGTEEDAPHGHMSGNAQVVMPERHNKSSATHR